MPFIYKCLKYNKVVNFQKQLQYQWKQSQYQWKQSHDNDVMQRVYYLLNNNAKGLSFD